MNKYEALTIFSSSLNEESLDAIIKKYSDIVESNGGKVLLADKWGVKKFAYTIDYKREGHYVMFEFESDANVPAKFSEILNIDENAYRTLILRKDA